MRTINEEDSKNQFIQRFFNDVEFTKLHFFPNEKVGGGGGSGLATALIDFGSTMNPTPYLDCYSCPDKTYALYKVLLTKKRKRVL